MQKTKKGAVTSLWELTVSERTNACKFIQHTTAKPFVYCRHYFKCFFCRENYFDIRKLMEHTSNHEIPDETKILNEMLTKGRRTLKVDISELKCRICQKEFTNLDVIREHLTSEHSIPFTESGNVIVPYNLATVSDAFSCHICNKKFQSFFLLNQHMNVHYSNSVCEICGATFMTHQRMIQHKEIHQPGGYPCKQCSKVYTTNSNLKFHVEKEHEGKRLMRMLRCSHCSERFTEHFKKLKHLKVVHGVTFTFECDICKSVFPSRRALTAHTNRQHSDKTQCEVCKKCFSCITTLRQHMICHSGERNHVCGVCQKAFRQKKTLKSHLKTHNGEPCVKFTCPECSSGFPNRNEFNRHVKDWHPSNYFHYILN